MDKLERRHMERFFLELPAFFTVQSNGNENQSPEFTTHNICAGGAYFETQNPLSIDTKGIFDIKLPIKSHQISTKKQSHILVKGKVVRSEKKGMAVSFDANYQILSLPTDCGIQTLTEIST